MDGMLAELAELRAENLRLTAALEAASELQDDAEAYADGRGGGVAAVEAAACAAAQASSALQRRPVPAPLDDLDYEPRDASGHAAVGHAAVTIARAVVDPTARGKDDPTARGKDADPRPDAARRAGTALDGARPVRRVLDGSAAAAAAAAAVVVDGTDGADGASAVRPSEAGAVRQSDAGAVRQSEAGAVRQSEAGAVRQSEAGAAVHGLSKWTGKSLSAEMDE
jgi:hypothetical protein